MANNKAVFKRDGQVHPSDMERVKRAQERLLLLYRRLGNWRAVGAARGCNHKYVYDLALFGKVPSNPDIRVKVFLPRVLPSERKPKAAREPTPKVWERPDLYFRKVKR